MSFSESLVETVVLFADQWKISPFEIFKQDIDDFILLINYHIRLGKNKENKQEVTNRTKEQRIRVNDKTASGGWF